ncbi:hypothetical protein JL09_g1260 [Pichia kudriavzevii]|uniref:SWR1-complex protein 4 n=1 Tax=Pichia kudriavzevii TaxID=4909 RepID=A0A099P3C1_PICKU|nr:hypothetical protein JL09_g1260 [Pichia kudriavzevii]
MSDILDVMNIKSFPQRQKKKKEPSQSQQNLVEARQIYTPEEYASDNQKRKLSAMNRELYNLIGTNVPPLAVDTASVTNAGGTKKFKAKLVTLKKDQPWRKLGFKNSARDDDLILYHWAKTNLDKNVAEPKKEEEEEEEEEEESSKIEIDPNEYRFTKYNTRLEIPSFSRKEYDEAFRLYQDSQKKLMEIKLAQDKSKEEKEKERDYERETEKGEDKRKDKGKEKEKEKKQETQNEKEKEEEKEKKPETQNEKEKEEDIKETSTINESVETVTKNNDNEEKQIVDSVENNGEVTAEKVVKEEADTKANTETQTEIEESKESSEFSDPKEREWTYEETKKLFDLCSLYDMRWAVIYDRFQDDYPDRSLEDLKAQMYNISANLLEKRGDINDRALIKSLRSFDKERELLRKHYLTRLIHRAPTEIAEEESLVIEARKFELAAKKMLYERGQLLQLLDSPQSSASVQQYLTSQGLTQLYNSLMSSEKSKKRKAEIPVAPLLGPNAIPHTQHISMSNAAAAATAAIHPTSSFSAAATASAGMSLSNSTNSSNKRRNAGTNVSGRSSTPLSQGQKGVSKLSEIQQLLHKTLSEEDLQVYGIEIHQDRIQPGVYVRSQKIASFKPSVQAKVHEILGQLGMSVKPTIPTGPVAKKFDELLHKISHLVDLKKQSDKITTEIELVKRQKGLL